MGCYWNIPGNYDSGSFDQCNANLPAQAMGEYKLKNGQTSTWHQGVNVSRLDASEVIRQTDKLLRDLYCSPLLPDKSEPDRVA